MSKFLSKKLLEDGNGHYIAQLGFNRNELKALKRLVMNELARQRKEDKGLDFQHLHNTAATFHEAQKYIQIAHNKRQQGRFTAAPPQPEKEQG